MNWFTERSWFDKVPSIHTKSLSYMRFLFITWSFPVRPTTPHEHVWLWSCCCRCGWCWNSWFHEWSTRVWILLMSGIHWPDSVTELVHSDFQILVTFVISGMRLLSPSGFGTWIHAFREIASKNVSDSNFSKVKKQFKSPSCISTWYPEALK